MSTCLLEALNCILQLFLPRCQALAKAGLLSIVKCLRLSVPAAGALLQFPSSLFLFSFPSLPPLQIY